MPLSLARPYIFKKGSKLVKIPYPIASIYLKSLYACSSIVEYTVCVIANFTQLVYNVQRNGHRLKHVAVLSLILQTDGSIKHVWNVACGLSLIKSCKIKVTQINRPYLSKDYMNGMVWFIRL